MKLLGPIGLPLYAMITSGMNDKNMIGGCVNTFDPAAYLGSSDIIDSGHPDIVAKAKSIADKVNLEMTTVGEETEQECGSSTKPNNPKVIRDREIIRQTFEFVRDDILHSWDYGRGIVQLKGDNNEGNSNDGDENWTPPKIPVTCKASDALRHQTGYCYSKAHLLAALLRANGIPTGLCYQRLTIADDGSSDGPFCLHGLNAVYLEEEEESHESVTTPKTGYWYRIDPRGLKPTLPKADFCPPTEALAFQTKTEGEMDFSEIYVDPLPIVVEALEKYTTWEDVAENLPDMKQKNCPNCG